MQSESNNVIESGDARVWGVEFSGPRGGGLLKCGAPPERAPLPTWLVSKSELFTAQRAASSSERRYFYLGAVTLHDHKSHGTLADVEIHSAPIDVRTFGVFSAICQRLAMPSEVHKIGGDDEACYLSCRHRLSISSGVFQNYPIARVHLAWTDLLRDLGMTDTGANRRVIRNAIENLENVTVSWSSGKAQSRLVCFLPCSPGCFNLLVSPLLWMAPESKRGVVWVDLAEQRMLRSAAAKRLHAWLSWWAPSSGGKGVRMHLLARHVWGERFDGLPFDGRAKQMIRAALHEVGSLPGWLVGEGAREMVYVSPPRYRAAKGRGKRLEPSANAAVGAV